MLTGLLYGFSLVIQTCITQTECSLNCLLGDLATKHVNLLFSFWAIIISFFSLVCRVISTNQQECVDMT